MQHLLQGRAYRFCTPGRFCYIYPNVRNIKIYRVMAQLVVSVANAEKTTTIAYHNHPVNKVYRPQPTPGMEWQFELLFNRLLA